MYRFGRLITIVCVTLVLFPFAAGAAWQLVWPTPNTAFFNGAPIEDFIQPTVSGDPYSGTFGGVRNNGTRFHEGLDIKPVLKRTKKGEPTDPVFAAMDGEVAYFSSVAGQSSYGRYIVLTHQRDGIKLYTLYAHLASVSRSLRKGQFIIAGTEIGTMGRSAGGYAIPKERAHLHFEIGLVYGNTFQAWYDRQKFGSQNYHGNYNGMNMEGFDPQTFFKAYIAKQVPDLCAYVKSLPVAYVMRVDVSDVPSIVRGSPGLVTGQIPQGGAAAWDVSFTWFGLPVAFVPVRTDQLTSKDHPGIARLKAISRKNLAGNNSRNTVRMKNGKPVVYKGAIDDLELIFGRSLKSK